MYRRAKAEIIRVGLTLEPIAREMGITVATLSQKLNEKYPMTVNEAREFKRIIKSSLSLEELFESTEEAS